jgi:hypothetical protein
MAKIHHRKARKDYPEAGIKKGDMYYYCAMKTGPRSSKVMRQLTPFKPWQTTTSAFFAALWQWEDEFQRMEGLDDVEEMLIQLRDIGEEEQQKFDNMPEGLQMGDTGQMLEERATACETAADEIESIRDEIDNFHNATDDERAYILDSVKKVTVDV